MKFSRVLRMMAAHFTSNPVVSISVSKHVYAPNETMSVVIVPDTPTHELSWNTTIESFNR